MDPSSLRLPPFPQVSFPEPDGERGKERADDAALAARVDDVALAAKGRERDVDVHIDAVPFCQGERVSNSSVHENSVVISQLS